MEEALKAVPESGQTEPETGQPERQDKPRLFRSIIKNNWVVLILGLLFIFLLVVVALLLLYTNLTFFQAVILLICVAYFPLTYLAYQLRSEKHKERIVIDFRLLGLIEKGQEKLVEEQYQKIHSPQQYVIYISLASLVTMLGFGLLYFSPRLLTDFMSVDSETVSLIMFYSFLGAFVFSIFNVYRRYMTFDLQPGVYLYVVVMTLTVMIVAFILSDFLDNIQFPYLIPVVAFLIGYLPDAGMRLITSLGSRVIGIISRNETSLGSINGMSIWHETRLRESGIDNTQNLQATDVREILLSSRFSAQQLMNWIDQAILINNVNPAVLKELNNHSIHTITAFISLVDNRGLDALPILPPEVLSKDDVDKNGGVLPIIPDSDEGEAGGDQLAEPTASGNGHQDSNHLNNLKALNQAIYYATDTSPNYYYVQRYWQAVRRFRERQVDTALERYLQELGIKVVEALLLDPDMIEQMGRAWRELDLPPEMLPNLFPNTAEGKVSLGNLYVELDRFPNAMQAFKEAISEKPDYAPSFASRGMAYSIRREFYQAFADFHQAKTLSPDYAVTYHHEGVTHMKRGQYDEAIAAFNTAVQKDKTYAYGYFNRGRAYSLKGEFDRAQEDFSKALQLKRMERAYYERGVIFTYKAMFREAIDDFSTAIQMKRDDARFYAWRGFVYMLYGDYNRSRYDLDTAIVFDPMLAEAYNFRGQLYFQMEDEVSAANDFSKSLKLDPGQARLYYNRAMAHQKLGQLQNAIEDLNEYIRLSPQADDNEAVAKQIANLEGQLDEVAN